MYGNETRTPKAGLIFLERMLSVEPKKKLSIKFMRTCILNNGLRWAGCQNPTGKNVAVIKLKLAM